MASEGASGADRSERQDRSSAADAVGKETSDKVRDAVSGAANTNAAPEATAAERAASQDRMAATGTVARDAVQADIAARQPAVAPAAAAVEAQPAIANAAALPGVTLAQASPAVPATPALPGAMELGRGLRAMTPAGAVVAGSLGLQRLTDMAAEHRIASAGRTLGLDMTTAEGILGANAYASAKETMSHGLGGLRTGLDYGGVETRGPTREAAARAVAQNEMANPGDWARATRAGDPEARARVQGAIDGALAGVAAGHPVPAADAPLDLSGIAVERASAVDPALSASSPRARAILADTDLQNWRAHHLIPFAEVASLPVPAQEAMVRAGWRMDSAGNLIALPGDMPTYTGALNDLQYPIHSGAHPTYSAAVGARLRAEAMNYPNMTPAEVRASLAGIEAWARLELRLNVQDYHAWLK